MSEPRIISPLLDDFALGGSMSYHSGVNCYPAMRENSDERYIVKTISIPASQTQLEALLLTGAYPNAEAARIYFHELAQGVVKEVEVLNKLSTQRGFLPFQGYQVDPMPKGVGYDVFLLSHYRQSLERFLKRSPMTHLSAVNMGIDLCAALAVCRENGYLYVDLKPANIFLSGLQEYHIGDLGFISLDSLKYASLPDRCRSWWTPPEVTDAYAQLNTTMDTYALGLVLYQVYNNGKLPFDTDESRKAFMDRLANGDAMPSPMFADYEMEQIISKACAYDPAERWNSPEEMGRALISYMQRNGANDIPIGPVVIPQVPVLPEEPAQDLPDETSEADAPVEEARSEADEAAEEANSEASESESEGSEPASEAFEAERGVSEPEGEACEAESDMPEDEAGSSESELAALEAEDASSEAEDVQSIPADDMEAFLQEAADDEDEIAEEDWIDRMNAILSENKDDEDDSDEDGLSLRELLTGDDGALENEDGDEVCVDLLSEETAGILSQADELIAQEVPEPAVAPEPIEIPMPRPIIEEDEDADEYADDAEYDGSEADEEPDFEDEDEYGQFDESPRPKGRFKKILAWIAALLVLAGLGYGGYHLYTEYYLQEVTDLAVTGEADTMRVSVVTELDPSLITVLVMDQYGDTQTAPLTDGSASFSALTPDTQYTITLDVDGFHKLTGKTTAQYYTLPQTNIVSFSAVTGPEDGSVILNFAVEGPAVETWTVEYATAGEEPAALEFNGTMITITGLTPGCEYTFTLRAGDDVYMIGQTQISYTATNVIYAENLAIASLQDNAITVTWNAPEGISVNSWTVRCYNESGYDQALNTAETTAVFTQIDPGCAYTVEVTAAGMTQSQRTYISANPINITALTPSVSGSELNVSWQYEGNDPDGGWLLVYTVDQGDEQHVVQCAEPTATISPIAPGSHYELSVQTASSATVFGGTVGTDIPQAGRFSQMRLSASDITAKLVIAPAESGWSYKDVQTETNQFAVGDPVGVTLFTRKTYSIKDTPFTTLFVVRDSAGKLVNISSSTESWADMWERGRCELNVPQVPTVPGTYSLQIYMGGQLLTTLEMTIG